MLFRTTISKGINTIVPGTDFFNFGNSRIGVAPIMEGSGGRLHANV